MKLQPSYLMMFLSITSIAFSSQQTTEELIYSFLKPVKCTRAGLRCYIRHTFNQRAYVQFFLPRTFMHMIDILEFGKNIDRPRSFIESVALLFLERFQESRYINPYAAHELLQMLPGLIGNAFKDKEDITKQLINDHLLTALKTRFSDLKKDPHAFLSLLSQEIYDIIQDPDDIPVIRAQFAMVRLFDQICNKLVFDPREDVETWIIFKQLIEDLSDLQNFNIIPDQKILNNLMWAVIYRYGYFIECAGSELSVDTYQKIKHELETAFPPALLIEEQEDLIVTKLQRLQQIVAEGLMKARAKEQGILTDNMNF